MSLRPLTIALMAVLCLIASGGLISARAADETPIGFARGQETAARDAEPPACPDPASIPRRIAKAEQVTLPILMYHHVRELPEAAGATLRTLTVSASAFGAQMAYLAQNGYHTVYFSDLVAYFDRGAALPDDAIIITFDDGWLEQYEVAYPILRKNCLIATFFPPTNWVDHSKLTLTWAQVEEMSKAGMEFGSHTANHYLLTGQTAEQITRQLEDSRKTLEGHVRTPIVALAYPGGVYNAAVASLVEKAGYGVAVGVSAGVTHKAEERFRLHRVAVNYADTVTTFAARLVPSNNLQNLPPPAISKSAARRLERMLDSLER
ncbi:MAG: polysaccharide deacetylase family protein [Chloroflexi bacterium]|nr:polysaccharide deacetylase family protein [Chloroflexota bacterium]